MTLLTAAQRAQLIANGQIAHGTGQSDFYPVVKLFLPDGRATWLLTDLDPEDPDIAFGLCDLGFGCPELGSVRLSELAAVRGLLGLPIERDEHFQADRPISAYAEAARTAGSVQA